MPVETGSDNKGCFARYGASGAKYYYPCGNKKLMGKAKQKATLQGIAIGKGKLIEKVIAKGRTVGEVI